MAKSVDNNSGTRDHILRAALKRFAHAGYAATSVQQIVGDAKVSKPALYYHFHDKAGLYQALVNEAQDERYRLMHEAAARTSEPRAQLVEIIAALFEYFNDNRELMRLSLATIFASPGELPEGLRHIEKGTRNFEFIHSLMKQALKSGALNGGFDSRELAFGFYGQINSYMMANLLIPGCCLNRPTAEHIVDLFMTGAGAKKKSRR